MEYNRKAYGLSEVELEKIIIDDTYPILYNMKPKTERELYGYYCFYEDIVIQYLRLKHKKFIRPLSNEIRAIMGHLAQYNDTSNINKRELEKAYGHFRRLVLDSFKIICDSYDDALYKAMKRQQHYNLNKVGIDYLQEYSKLYIKAKQLYISAQKCEKTGSDSTSDNNIILSYHKACVEYIKLKQLYCKNKAKVNKIIFAKNAWRYFTVFSFVFSTIVSIIDFILC